MPPRSSLTSSFSITDSNNEVVCPLRNQDGSSCRKRCVGEKRYRSMQEHIRRAHPEHYISKLPATEESFLLMINSPPSERPPTQPTSAPSPHHNKGYLHDNAYRDSSSGPGTPRAMDDYPSSSSLLPAASAAAALAQLHNHNQNRHHNHNHNHHLEPEWEPEAVSQLPSPIDWHSDLDKSRIPRSSIELPPIGFPTSEPTSEPFPSFNHHRQRDLLPSILANSPPGRSSTLPPLHGALGPNRPRKHSVSKKARQSLHKKQKSRGNTNDWLRRIQNEAVGDRLRPGGHIKAMSAEPSDYGKRWEDLIDAAASATEDIDEDRTPVPQSPISIQRASLPPFSHQPFQSYQASPLQQALTPPTYAQEAPEPFPSVESGESGDIFNMDAKGLADSSPAHTTQNPQIYCAACGNIAYLKGSYACTECICGLCQKCVEVLMNEQGSRRKCPRCLTIGGRFKPFQLDIR